MPANLKLTKANFVRVSGYFYHISETTDTLYKKVDSGENAFSYPLDTNITNEVKCIQHDGRRFWTLEMISGTYGTLIFRSWEIQDYILKLQRTYQLDGTSNQKYDASTFSIEHFHVSLVGTTTSGSTYLTLSPSGINTRLSPGDIIYLGPSTFPGDTGKYEERTILSIEPGNQVRLTEGTSYSYNNGDLACVSTRCWFFNKYKINDIDSNGTGALFSFDVNPLVTTVVQRKTGNEFRAVLASTFLTDPYYTTYNPSGRDFLIYVNQTNLLFIETDSSKPTYLSTIESAAQNNQEVNSTVIPIYDITHEGDTLFRLQHKATYRTGSSYTTEDWGSDFNYQVAVLKRLPQSISLTADPAIISADGVSTSHLTAIVKDQFDNAVPSKTVSFADNDTTGSPAGRMSGTQSVTNSQGIAYQDYIAGTEAKTVTITATV